MTWSTSEALKKTDISERISDNATLNSDSTTVLSWVKSPAINFKPYVKNKVIEIQNLLPSSNWRYVPSKENKPSDLLSKGCFRSDLDKIIEGPDIIRLPKKDWPEVPNVTVEDDDERSQKYEMKTAIIQEPIIDPLGYNSWGKLLRVTSYVYRFINKLKKKKDESSEDEPDYYANPSNEEMVQAEQYWMDWNNTKW